MTGRNWQQFVANTILILGILLVLLYYGPYLKYRWIFSVLLELLPYLSSMVLLGFVVILLFPVLRKQKVRLGVATLLLVLCWTPILRWVGLPSRGAVPEGIRVMTYNLWIDNPNLEAIEQSIEHENPDIVCLSEVSQATMEALRSQLNYPHDYRTTGGNNALLSRYPILEATTDDFGVTTNGRTFNLVAKLQVEDEAVTVIGVHPPIPVLQKFFHIRNQQLDTVAQAAQNLEGKLIVLGDFNATPWSPYFQRLVQRSQLQNAGLGQWIWATWYFNQRLSTRYIKIPIDHILI